MPSPKKEDNGHGEGVKDIDMIDPDDPEYQREGMRPSDVKEDVKLMDQRQRVQKILSSDAFRSELEDLIDSQLSSGGPQTPSILALRQLSDLLGSRSGFKGPSKSGVLPINDIRGAEVGCYSRTERILRCKLASCYRLLDINGWTHGIFNHISVRVDEENVGPLFLINPFGLLYSEVTASSLVKVDTQGNIFDQGSTTLGINRAGWNLHSALHTARPDLRCIIHVHTPSVVAVSASKHGLLPGLSQEAMSLHPITYHDFEGIVVNEEERKTITNDIGPDSKVLFLRNHGMVIGGATVEEAYNILFNAMAAVDVQARLGTNVEPDSVYQASEEAMEQVVKITRQPVTSPDTTLANESNIHSFRKWGVGELEYEALMRQLDNAGYRTGYPYRQTDVGKDLKKPDRDDIEIPPASTSTAYLYADDEERAKIAAAHRLMAERARAQHRTEWLTTPNTYRREEIEETGTDKPRKFTRWVAEKNGEHTNTALTAAVRSPNQFAPQGDNPREFKQQQKKIRGKYFDDARTAGPQSRLLDGITEQEARKLVEEGRAKMSGDRTVIVGAASMGIIQKEHRENAVVYHNVYTPNPFEKITDEELSKYHDFVQAKNKSPGENEVHENMPDNDGKNEPAADSVFSSNRPTNVADPKRDEGVHAHISREDRKNEMVAKLSEDRSIEEEAVVSAPEIVLPVEETVETVNTDTLRSETSVGGDTTSQDESRASQSKDDKKKKQKRGFRMPSFSKKKDKK